MALTKTQVSELFVAIFNRASEGDGNEHYQNHEFLTSPTDVANDMLATQDAIDYFGSSLDTNQAFIEHIYLNTLNKTVADDPDGIAFWVGRLDGTVGGTPASRGEVVAGLVEAAQDPVNAGAAQDQFNNRVTVSDYTADNLAAAPTDLTSLAFDGGLTVTDDLATVASAESAVDDLASGSDTTFTLTTDADSAAEGAPLTITVTASKAVEVDTDVVFSIEPGDVAAEDQGGTLTNLNDFIGGSFNDTTVTILAGETTATYIVTAKIEGVTEFPETYTVSAVVDGNTLTQELTVDDGVAGETLELTTGIDKIKATSVNTIDTVVGLIADTEDGDESTFGILDDIQGNGLTEVQVIVTGLDNTTYDPGAITMSGVNQLDIVGAASGSVTLDASGYGTDISKLNLVGVKATDLHISGLETSGALDIQVAGEGVLNLTSGSSTAPNFIDGLELSLSASGTADFSIGMAAINATLEDGAYADITYGNYAAGASKDVSVGDIVIGDISLSSGDADLYFSLENFASVHTGEGDATVGSVTIGDLTLNVGGFQSHSINQYAYASSGDASVGDMTIGNVVANVVDSGAYLETLDIYREAYAWETGDVAIGNLSVGNISMMQTAGATSNVVSLSAYAYASGVTAAASIGSTTIGNILIDAGIDATDNNLWIYNWAYADNADASIGDITVGNITVDMADSATGWASISATASATGSGNATIGNMLIGDIAMMAGVSGDFGWSLENEVSADSGIATIGDTTIGNISMTGATSASLYFSASNEADVTSGTAAVASIGNMTIGNIDVNLGSNAEATFYAYQFADADSGASSSVGTQTVGNITVNADIGGYFYGSVENEAWDGTAVSNSAGAQTVGDINMTGGAFADLGFGVSMSAASGVAGDQTVGNVTAFVENSASASYWQSVYAGTVGNVTLGDQTVTLGTNANYTYGGVYVSATNSDIGNVSIGNIAFIGAKGAEFSGSSYGGIQIQEAAGSVGDISYGNIDVQLGDSGVFEKYSLNATGVVGSVGNTTIGNVSLDAAADSASATWGALIGANEIGTFALGDVALSAGVSGSAFASITLNATTDVGAVTIGDVSLSAAGTNATANMGISVTAAGTYGDMTVGNISIDLDMTNDAVTAINNFATLDIATGATTTTVGDITLSSSGVVLADTAITTAAAAAFSTANVSNLAVQEAFVNIAGVNLVIGDVTVSGGAALATTTGAAVIYADNFGNFDWLNMVVSGDVTIGNIDYSGYEGITDIDVSGFTGAAEILAAQGGGTITLNTTKNTVTLNDAVDDVIFDAATTLKASADVIDELINFVSETDLIIIDTDVIFDAATSLGAFDSLNGFAFAFAFAFDSFGDTYANFLADAGNAMTNSGIEIFAQTDGTDTWVGIDADDDGNLDFSIALTGITSVTADDFVIS